ncbi:MAG: hypothetical protein ACP5RD_07570 [bacterium]
MFSILFFGKILIKSKKILLFFFSFVLFFKILVYSKILVCSHDLGGLEKNVNNNEFILEPVLMFFSNSPEYVNQNGYLISGYISAFTPTLIYFYHLNNSEIYKQLVIKFYNNGVNEVYIDSLFSSGDNYFKVGADINNKMLKNFNPVYFSFENEYVIKIPFKQKELLSGFIWIFSNNGINFESYVCEDKLDYRYLLKTDNKHVKGIFGISRILTYLPKDQDIIVGDIPLVGIESNMLLKGTYKVMYHFVVKRSGDIYFNPRGGPSRPSFVIFNGFNYCYFTQGNVFKEYTENKLTENNNYIVEFITIPEGASYYPVRFLIK